MMELLTINFIYVMYRLVVSGFIVKLLMKKLPYYVAVFVMAQFSYAYDTVIFGYYFSAQELPPVLNLLFSNILYTLRVLAAWFVIKMLWNWCKNYWIAVFLGAELTFLCDYFIFNRLFS